MAHKNLSKISLAGFRRFLKRSPRARYRARSASRCPLARYTGLEVSTLDKTRVARWKSYVELSGEKLAFDNVVENATAHVAAGASYATSSSTQLDFNVSRGTTWTSNDLTSNVGLSVRF